MFSVAVETSCAVHIPCCNPDTCIPVSMVMCFVVVPGRVQCRCGGRGPPVCHLPAVGQVCGEEP